MRRGRGRSLAAVAGLAVPVALGSVPASAATAAKPYDVNGDGHPDLVVGAPDLDRARIDRAGGVVVAPASKGASFAGARLITQSTAKVAGSSEPGDHFGSAVASADFDRDGYADLVVGTPGKNFTGKDSAGAVTILYGTAKGLSGARSKQISEPSGKEAFAGFGSALAAGDLNGDGYPDLAVGAPGDDRDAGARTDWPASGTVTVLLGGADGVRTTGSRVLRGVRGTIQQDYGFGSSLAVANVDGTGPADVVVLSKGHVDTDDGDGYPGYAAFCSGATGGPSTCRRLPSGNVQNNNAVVVGNVQGDARPEIVIGVPTSNIVSDVGHLEVLTLTGTGAGTTSHPTSLFHGDLGLPGSGNADEEGVDSFGYSLALGRVDGDSYDDLAIGAPTGKVGNERAGRVHVVHGGSAGLAKTGNSTYDQDTAGVPGSSESGDQFGAAVTLLDRNRDGKADLTIGAPGEDDNEGRVTTLLGTGSGITTTGSSASSIRNFYPRYDNSRAARFGAVLGQ